MARFVMKRNNEIFPCKIEENDKNNVVKKNNVMTTEEKIKAASEILGQPTVKRVRKDNGLFEKTESSVTVFTEDNKELLKD
jgi:hypothetical protein